MPCTTLLVGKHASYDGSTIIARNEDSGAFDPKQFLFMKAEDQPRHYTSKISHVEIDLPDDPLSYTYIPNVDRTDGIWASHGVNAANVAMSATETETSNERVGGADPYVRYVAAQGDPGSSEYVPPSSGGIGEEDLVTIVLPYIRSARDGVLRLGKLLETYGTYEMNGVAFSDLDEIWWLETIGGHHWIARRLPDDAYATIPNQFGLDQFDFQDAFGKQKNYVCSADLKDFIHQHHLDLTLEGAFNPREAFGSNSDRDHVYNTPRAWIMQSYFNPHDHIGEASVNDFLAGTRELPWCQIPERKITIEDVKYILSNHYQGTPYNVYKPDTQHIYRPIGVHSNLHLAIIQIRPYVEEDHRVLKWITYASNVFNAITPYYTNITVTPDYLAKTPAKQVDTHSYYWQNRLIAALADSHYDRIFQDLERYKLRTQTEARRLLLASDAAIREAAGKAEACEAANEKMAAMLKAQTDEFLFLLLKKATEGMKNSTKLADF